MTAGTCINFGRGVLVTKMGLPWFEVLADNEIFPTCGGGGGL